jgi:DNA-binding MarR family transcriptional regulator
MTDDDDRTGRCIPRAALARAALLLATAGDALLQSADATLAGSGLDGRGYSILSIIETDGPPTQQELARLLNKAPAIVVSAIDELEARGLVTRTRDPADRRRSRLSVTDAGTAALAEADRLADAAFDALFEGLGQRELRQLRDLLARGLAPVVDARSSAAA